MVLKANYDSLDDIPETVNFRELFTERDGKLELTGIDGIKTQADVTRLQTSLHKAQGDNKALKTQLGAWGELKPDDVHAQLDRIPELETAAKGKLDEAAIDEIVEKRVGGTLRSKLAPLERQVQALTAERDELKTGFETLVGEKRGRQREDLLRPLLVEHKVLPEHHEDVFMYAERHLGLTEDGSAWLTKENVGVTPGVSHKDWLLEMLEKRPGWLPGSKGGGARGSGGGGGIAQNPWSKEHWNLTAQGAYAQQHGMEKAKQAASAAGSKIGATRPPE